MKKFLSSLSLFVATAALSHGATLAWNANTLRNGFDAANGTDLEVGSLVRAGYFNTFTDAQIAQNANSLSGLQLLNADFREFAVAHIGESTGATPRAGHFTNSDSLGIAPSTPFSGRQIYIWAFRSTDNSSDVASFNSATEVGVFYMPFSADSDWRFPLDPEFGTTTIGMRDLTVDENADLSPDGNIKHANAQLVVGTFGPGTTAFGGTPNRPAFTLAAVPEPSTALMAIVGGIALISRRRRQS